MYKGIKMNLKNAKPDDVCQWDVPLFECLFWLGCQHKYCVVIPVINEGSRIISLLKRMKNLELHKQVDIIIIDGGSTDHSLKIELLRKLAVRGLLLKTSYGKLSAQLRCAYAFTLEHGYEGIITIDGNNKDDPSAIPSFIEALQSGVDFVQASRFINNGIAENTPMLRYLAIRCIHAPLLSFFFRF